MASPAERLPIVIVGHIDHGKSTLIGRLLYETGSLAAEKMEQISALSDEEKSAYPFAHLLDHFTEEREQGITIDTTQRFFRWAEREYLIIDAPGHREFLKNMITGAAIASAGVLIVDAERGVEEQTRQHGYLLHMIGIRSLLILINKMDRVGFLRERFEQTEREVTEFLSGIGLEPVNILPIAATLGDNLKQKSDKLRWFQGHTVLEALAAIQLNQTAVPGLRLPVQDSYDFLQEKKLLVGRVESGTLRAGGKATVLPQGAEVTIGGILKYKQSLQEAGPGECIAFTLEGREEMARGMILVDGELPQVSDRIACKLFWLGEKPGKLQDEIVFKCTTQQVPGVLTRILRCFDPSDLSKEIEAPAEISQGQIAEVELALKSPVVTDSFGHGSELGRFALEKNSEQIAGGIIP